MLLEGLNLKAVEQAVGGRGEAVEQAVGGRGEAVEKAVGGRGEAVEKAVGGRGKAASHPDGRCAADGLVHPVGQVPKARLLHHDRVVAAAAAAAAAAPPLLNARDRTPCLRPASHMPARST